MKTMTCSQLGGTCEEKIQGATPDEMIQNGMAHLKEAHPQMASDIDNAGKDDPGIAAWFEKFQKDFADQPEDAQ